MYMMKPDGKLELEHIFFQSIMLNITAEDLGIEISIDKLNIIFLYTNKFLAETGLV